MSCDGGNAAVKFSFFVFAKFALWNGHPLNFVDYVRLDDQSSEARELSRALAHRQGGPVI